MVSGYRDTFKNARETVPPKGRKFEPKFPAAALLDDDGQKREPEILLAAKDEAAVESRHHLGCPCCAARLRLTVPGERLGSRTPDPYFSSVNLDDHFNCELASPDEKVRKTAHRKVEFFMQEGAKLLYWNLPYMDEYPRFHRDFRSPLTHLGGPKFTGRRDDDAKITLGVKSMTEFTGLARYKSFQDPFWDDVHIYNERMRMPWRSFFYGLDRPDFLGSAFKEAVYNVCQPKVVLADIEPVRPGDLKMTPYRRGLRACFDAGRHLYSIETAPVEFTGQRSRMSTFRSQIVLQTHSDAVFHAIQDAAERAKPVMVHGISKLNPSEIQRVSERWPRGEHRDNILRSFLHMSTPGDVAVYKAPARPAHPPQFGNDNDYAL